MSNIKKQTLFYPDYKGSASYRIPSLLTTKKGTIIAGIDARIEHSRDNPNKIDTTIRRSEDNGETWGDIQKLVAYPGKGLDGAAAIDTAMVQDEQTGKIFMIFSHTPGGIGLWASEPGVGFDQHGRRQLYDNDGNVYLLQEDGTVVDSNENKTEYVVNEEGYVFKAGEEQGNIYYKKGYSPKESLLEARTTFLQIIHSEDDGLTWSKPRELNPSVKQEWMRFLGAGPGRGIQLKHGEKAGRLLFPIYFSNEAAHMSAALLYSDDHGETWELGESPNDGRELDGKILSAETLSEEKQYLTESQVIELPNGELRYYLRNHYGLQRTAVSTSKDGGETWGEVTFDMTLIDPICQSSVILYPDLGDGKVRVIFSNPAEEKERKTGTIRLSEDGGKTWPYSKVIEENLFGYSCLTVLETGEVGILYEKMNDVNDWSKIDIEFATFTLDWLKS
ncbi:sialidase family protein [Pseudogracilibacillus auburnensis]|uniref:sialidase family protein n=1 Tax=Pseudogracilibacillus auburnensis TaxID=1494959 RepID=UPI001A97B6BD|nr:sialidase family protein [Pseudogracilibacillus auburnensis]MBO1004819.1 exo-alpha-sialidase [Pseudogracilibacillus auburnensis]